MKRATYGLVRRSRACGVAPNPNTLPFPCERRRAGGVEGKEERGRYRRAFCRCVGLFDQMRRVENNEMIMCLAGRKLKFCGL